jgi:hypothetical protein
MESVDVSQPNSSNSLVPNAGQQGDTFSSNPLQLPSTESNQSASGEASSISDDAALNAATWFAKEQLDSFASDEDFLSNMEQAFGDNWLPQQAEDLIQDLASGDAMPKIEVMPSSDLKANGAFGQDTIYLSEEFLSNANSEQVSSGLIEEIGHFVDQKLNSGDSTGDEGGIFQQLVQDNDISEGELIDMRQEDDSETITLDGEDTPVELSDAVGDINLLSITVDDSADDATFTPTPYNGVPTDEIKLVINPNSVQRRVIDTNQNQEPLYVDRGEKESISKEVDTTGGNLGSATVQVFDKDEAGYELLDEKDLPNIIPYRALDVKDGSLGDSKKFEGSDGKDDFKYILRYRPPTVA